MVERIVASSTDRGKRIEPIETRLRASVGERRDFITACSGEPADRRAPAPDLARPRGQ